MCLVLQEHLYPGSIFQEGSSMKVNNVKILFFLFVYIFYPWARAALPPIRWPQAISEKNNEVIVGVIDTGLDLQHPLFKKSLWINPGESGLDKNQIDKSNNGIDDDRNGFVDDVHGWNFLQQNAEIKDEHGHGTHVAGLILSGDPRVKIMVLKNYHLKPEHNLMATIEAINYAVDQGVHVINFSGGGREPFQAEYQALVRAQGKNIWIVTAAGNEGRDNDQQGFYPASYSLENIFSVAALGKNNRRLQSSNFGKNSVDFLTLGENIRSAIPGGGYGEMTGTSQAAARTTGSLVKILLNSEQAMSASQLKEKISFAIQSR